MNYYRYGNATRRLRSGKFTFTFDVIEQFAGNWLGVLKLDNPEAITALEEIAARMGITSITEIEYDGLLKKKANFKPSSPDIIRLSTSALRETAAGVAVVKSPLSPIIPDSKASVGSPKIEVNDAIIIGEAPYVDPLATRTKTRKKVAA